MDLLFKNPRYFFDTYFDVPLWQLFSCWAIIAAVRMLFTKAQERGSVKAWLSCFLSSIPLVIILAVSLLNEKRGGARSLALNPLPDIRRFLAGEVHTVRQMLSNALLYMPYGFALRRKHRFSKAVFIGAFTSIAVEILQFVLSRGATEGMDVMMNTLGTLIGASLSL